MDEQQLALSLLIRIEDIEFREKGAGAERLLAISTAVATLRALASARGYSLNEYITIIKRNTL